MELFRKCSDYGKPLAISVIARDAMVCRAISHTLASPNIEVQGFESAEGFLCSESPCLADMLILGGVDLATGEDAPLCWLSRERPELPTLVIRKHGVEACRLDAIGEPRPDAGDEADPCERVGLLWSFLCRTGAGLLDGSDSSAKEGAAA